MNKEITFERLPEAVSYLTEQVASLKEMVSALQAPASEEKSLIGIEEACEVIQKAKPTIYALVRKGVIPTYKRGKKLYFYPPPTSVGRNFISTVRSSSRGSSRGGRATTSPRPSSPKSI